MDKATYNYPLDGPTLKEAFENLLWEMENTPPHTSLPPSYYYRLVPPLKDGKKIMDFLPKLSELPL